MSPLPPVLRRALALGLALGALLGVWRLGALPLYRATKETVEELNDARFELHRLSRLSQESRSVTPETLAQEAEALRGALFVTQAVSRDNSMFVSAVDQLVRTSGAQLGQLKAAEPQRLGPLFRFTLDLNASGREEDLVRLLTAIESHRPALLIDRAVMVSQGAGPETPSPDLTIELRISGFGAELGETNLGGGGHGG